MLFDFGALTYFQSNASISHFELLVQRVYSKAKLHKKHLLTTIDLYNKEYETNRAALIDSRDQALREAKIRYDKIMVGAEDNENNRAWASHDSGENEIFSNYSDEEEQLYSAMKELAEHLNRSAVVVAYSLFESELRDACLILQKAFSKRIGLSNIAGSNYIKAMSDYLELVLELDIAQVSPYLSKIERLQFLRNRLVHEGGLITADFDKMANLEQIIAQSGGLVSLGEDKLSGGKILNINSEKFLIDYYFIIVEFFCELLWSVNSKMAQVLIQNRFTYLFGFAGTEVAVTVKAVSKVKKGVQSICELRFDEDGSQITVELKITFTRSKYPKLNIVKQISSTYFDRLINYLEAYPGQVFESLEGFTNPVASSEISIMLSDA